MAKLKSNSPQPLYLNLTGGKTMKISARGTAEVDDEYLHCLEMTYHQSRGNLTVLEPLDAARGVANKVKKAAPGGKQEEEAAAESVLEVKEEGKETAVKKAFPGEKKEEVAALAPAPKAKDEGKGTEDKNGAKGGR